MMLKWLKINGFFLTTVSKVRAAAFAAGLSPPVVAKAEPRNGFTVTKSSLNRAIDTFEGTRQLLGFWTERNLVANLHLCNADSFKFGSMLALLEPHRILLSQFLAFIAILIAVIWGFRVQKRRSIDRLRLRLDDQLEERTRIACELHDTLLQTLQGSKFVADEAAEDLNDLPKMQRAVVQLAEWLDRAVFEGRTALDSLRLPLSSSDDLALSLHRASLEWASSVMKVSAAKHGSVKEMHPVIKDEVMRIALEAVRNACVHSKGTSLAINVSYDRNLTLSICDNGCGLNLQTIANGKPGHFGIAGMRDRAARIGGRLTFRRPGRTGTEVVLEIPGRIVFYHTPGPTLRDSFQASLKRLFLSAKPK